MISHYGGLIYIVTLLYCDYYYCRYIIFFCQDIVEKQYKHWDENLTMEIKVCMTCSNIWLRAGHWWRQM